MATNEKPFLSAAFDICHLVAVWWWRNQMETFSAFLALCAGNSPVTGEFPTQRPVTRSFDVFFDMHLNKRLSKQSWGWWFETLASSLWRHCNVHAICNIVMYRNESKQDLRMKLLLPTKVVPCSERPTGRGLRWSVTIDNKSQSTINSALVISYCSCLLIQIFFDRVINCARWISWIKRWTASGHLTCLCIVRSYGVPKPIYHLLFIWW